MSAAQLEAEGLRGASHADRPLSKKPKATHWARDVSAYDILEPIGEGTYGKVRSVHPRLQAGNHRVLINAPA